MGLEYLSLGLSISGAGLTCIGRSMPVVSLGLLLCLAALGLALTIVF